MYTVLHIYWSPNDPISETLLQRLANLSLQMPEKPEIREHSASFTLSLSSALSHFRDLEVNLQMINSCLVEFSCDTLEIQVDLMFEHEDWTSHPYEELVFTSQLLRKFADLNMELKISLCPPAETSSETVKES